MHLPCVRQGNVVGTFLCIVFGIQLDEQRFLSPHTYALILCDRTKRFWSFHHGHFSDPFGKNPLGLF